MVILNRKILCLVKFLDKQSTAEVQVQGETWGFSCFFKANRFVTLKMDEMVLCDVYDVICSDDPAENFYQFGFPLYLLLGCFSLVC